MENWYKARREELRKRSNKGFTLMEMLIVVAIIAVLIAIAIPVFTSQLENSREASDAANIRSAYAEVTAAALSNEQDASILSKNGITYDTSAKEWKKDVKLQQQTANWNNSSLKNQSIGSIGLSSAQLNGVDADKTVTVKVKADGTTSFSIA